MSVGLCYQAQAFVVLTHGQTRTITMLMASNCQWNGTPPHVISATPPCHLFEPKASREPSHSVDVPADVNHHGSHEENAERGR